MFSVDSSSQQTSTPKFDRQSAATKLFNANESAILDPDGSPMVSGTEKRGEAGVGVVQQTTHKRRLFHCEVPAGCAGTLSHDSGSPNAKRQAFSVKTDEYERIDGRLSRVSRIPESLIIANPSAIIEDPVGQKWTPVQIEEFFNAVLECGADCMAIERRMKNRLRVKLGERARTKCLLDIRKYIHRVITVVARLMEIGEADEPFQTYALVNFGVWNKNFGVKGCQDLGKPVPTEKGSFRALFNSGTAEVRKRSKKSLGIGKNLLPEEPVVHRLRTPECPALRRLHGLHDFLDIPVIITLCLRPRLSSSWANVARAHRNPLVHLTLNRSHNIKYLLDFLTEYWFINREKERFYNSEQPVLVLRPSSETPVHWPEIMPDFDVLHGRRSFCWHSCLSYEKSIAVQKAARISNSTPAKNHKINSKLDDDICFYGEDFSDEEEMATTVTVIKPPPRIGSPEIFKDYYDNGQVKFTSLNSKHLHVTAAELYTIAGYRGKLLMDYEWIVPDQKKSKRSPVELTASQGVVATLL